MHAIESHGNLAGWIMWLAFVALFSIFGLAPVGASLGLASGGLDEPCVALTNRLIADAGAASADSYPILFELDANEVQVARRFDVQEGGVLGGEDSVEGAIDLRRTLHRAYAPADRVGNLRMQLRSILGHDDFEVLAPH